MNKTISLLLIFFNSILAMDNTSYKNKLAVICVPDANLFDQKPNNDSSPALDTQLLYNEQVTILEFCDRYYKVATPEQMKVEGNTQAPHQGWVEEKYVALQEPYLDNNTSFPIIVQSSKAIVGFSSDPDQNKSKMLEVVAGTKLYAHALGDNSTSYKVTLIDGDTKQHSTGYINKTDVCKLQELRNLDTPTKRDLIIKYAQKFLNTPYVLGGMTYKGIDCSGLTHLLYRMIGFQIPRDSKDQYAAAKKHAPKDLEKADLIFLAHVENPERIRHVMLYAGNDKIIDAVATDTFGKVIEKVRITTGQEWLGKPFTQIGQKEQVGPYIVYGGTFLS